MSNAWTPGPWRIVPDEEGDPARCVTSRGFDIATVWGGYLAADADVSLISAAPDLAMALAALLDAGDSRKGSREERDAIAALAKARGEA